MSASCQACSHHCYYRTSSDSEWRDGCHRNGTVYRQENDDGECRHYHEATPIETIKPLMVVVADETAKVDDAAFEELERLMSKAICGIECISTDELPDTDFWRWHREQMKVEEDRRRGIAESMTAALRDELGPNVDGE